MKKLSLVFMFHLLLVSISFAQPVIEWQRTFGGSSYEQDCEIFQTIDGGYISFGITGSNDGDITFNHGSTDLWVFKMDPDGNLQWQKSYGGSDFDGAADIKATSDRGYIISGSTSSSDGDVTFNHGGQRDCWIIKIDYNGNIQWQKTYGGSDTDAAGMINQTSDGGYLFAGTTWSNDGDVSGNHDSTTSDVWAVKLDNSGNIQWQKCLGGINDDDGGAVLQTTDGGFMIAGGWGTSNFIRDYWVVKLDSLGNLVWQNTYGGTSDDEVSSMIHTSDGGYILIGASESNDLDVTGHHGYVDYWVVKLDPTGNLQWQKSLGGANCLDWGHSIQQTNDNGYIVCGESCSSDGDISSNYGNYDVWIVKLDSTGNLQWEKNYGGTSGDYAYSIIKDLNNDFVFAGYTSSNDYDVTNNHGLDDLWVVKLTGDFNEIIGKLFIDLNNDQVFNSGEPLLNKHLVNEINSGRFSFSNNDGNYNLSVLDSGNFSISPSPLPYYNSVPASHSVTFNSINQKDSLNDFAFQPAGVFNDLCLDLTPLGRFRSGFNGSYRLDYQNVGTTTLSGTVIFYPDSNLSYVSSSVTPTFISPDSVVWNVGSLSPFQTGSLNVTFYINTGLQIGSLIYSTAYIDPVAGDANPQCNYASWEVYTTGSFDPNAIFVDKEILEITQFPNPPWLDYIIYFQNTGNDTAFTVKIMDDIPAELDMSTLSFVSSSHPVTMRNIPVSRYIEFKFDNILLPDSNVNEPLSHGFIRYRIKPKSSLVLGDSIKNSAYIYFDLNKPVQTNVATTAILLPTGISSYTTTPEQKISIYPNPASGELTVKWLVPVRKNENSLLKIFDMMGRVVYEKSISSERGQQVKIDVSPLVSGIYLLQLSNNRKAFVRK